MKKIVKRVLYTVLAIPVALIALAVVILPLSEPPSNPGGPPKRTPTEAQAQAQAARIKARESGVAKATAAANLKAAAARQEDYEVSIAQRHAQAGCHALVLDQLKSPSTAKITIQGTIVNSSFSHKRPKNATDVEWAFQFVTIGYVDSQNSFGAMLRNEFRCLHNGRQAGAGLAAFVQLTNR